MGRKRILVWSFAQFGAPHVGKQYAAQVVTVNRSGDCGIVLLKHLDGDQAGRTLELRLPLPIRPEGLGTEFCSACGLAIDQAKGIDPTGAIGKIIGVVFGRSPQGVTEVVSLHSLDGVES